jgi:hypothetical protein
MQCEGITYRICFSTLTESPMLYLYCEISTSTVGILLKEMVVVIVIIVIIIIIIIIIHHELGLNRPVSAFKKMVTFKTVASCIDYSLH